MDYLLSFLIGSSILNSAHFLVTVSKMAKNERHFQYKYYSVTTPIYFGLLNMLIVFLHKKYKISFTKLYLLFGFLSPLFILFLVEYNQAYDWNKRDFGAYVPRLFMAHFLTFNLLLKNFTTLFIR